MNESKTYDQLAAYIIKQKRNATVKRKLGLEELSVEVFDGDNWSKTVEKCLIKQAHANKIVTLSTFKEDPHYLVVGTRDLDVYIFLWSVIPDTVVEILIDPSIVKFGYNIKKTTSTLNRGKFKVSPICDLAHLMKHELSPRLKGNTLGDICEYMYEFNFEHNDSPLLKAFDNEVNDIQRAYMYNYTILPFLYAELIIYKGINLAYYYGDYESLHVLLLRLLMEIHQHYEEDISIRNPKHSPDRDEYVFRDITTKFEKIEQKI